MSWQTLPIPVFLNNPPSWYFAGEMRSALADWKKNEEPAFTEVNTPPTVGMRVEFARLGPEGLPLYGGLFAWQSPFRRGTVYLNPDLPSHRIRDVFAHELGHSLGLPEESIPDDASPHDHPIMESRESVGGAVAPEVAFEQLYSEASEPLTNDLSLVLDLLTRAAMIASCQLVDPSYLVRAYNKIVGAYEHLRWFDECADLSQRALTLPHSDAEDIGLNYSLGSTLLFCGLARPGIYHLRRARDVARRIGDVMSAAGVGCRLGQFLRDRKKHRFAERFVRQAIADLNAWDVWRVGSLVARINATVMKAELARWTCDFDDFLRWFAHVRQANDPGLFEDHMVRTQLVLLLIEGGYFEAAKRLLPDVEQQQFDAGLRWCLAELLMMKFEMYRVMDDWDAAFKVLVELRDLANLGVVVEEDVHDEFCFVVRNFLTTSPFSQREQAWIDHCEAVFRKVPAEDQERMQRNLEANQAKFIAIKERRAQRANNDIDI